MKNQNWIFMGLIWLLVCPVFGENDAGADWRVTSVTGSVLVQSADTPDAWIEAEADMPIESGDVIKTTDGASAEIAAGGDTVVLLEEKTELKAENLNSRFTKLFLSIGSLTAKIKSLLRPDDQFHIRTTIAVAAVRGTEVAVTSSGGDGPTYIGVFDEGAVSVEAENGSTQLASGEETEVLKGAPPAAPRPLRHFVPLRPRVVRARERALALKAGWRPLPAALRRERRQRFIKRGRIRPAAPIRRNAPPARPHQRRKK